MISKIGVAILLFRAAFTPLFSDPLHFSIIVPSYNNEKFCEGNLNSLLSQTYPYYTVYYIDDASTDQTLQKIKNLLVKHPQGKKVKMTCNINNKGALANIYSAISLLVPKEDVVVIVDGDDALAHKDVLKFLAGVYQNKNIWLTYGQFQYKSSGKVGFCAKVPRGVIEAQGIRKLPYIFSHLKTFYAWLFRKIKMQDLMEKGKFFDVCSDVAIMFPMLEMARSHFQFIPDILYIYNDQNPLNDFRKNRQRQLTIDKAIRQKPPYAPIN